MKTNLLFVAQLSCELATVFGTIVTAPKESLVEEYECGTIHEFTPPTIYDDGETKMLMFNTDDDALSYAESMYLNTSAVPTVPLFAKASLSLITDLSITELPISKRWSCSSAPLGTHFTQRQVAQHGTWWGEWKPASQCFWNEHGQGGSRTASIQSCRSWTVGAGFTADIMKGLGYNINWSVTNQDCKTDTWTCDLGNARVLEMWKQQEYVWADQQTQRCVRKYYGKDGCKCGAWGPYIHGDIPTNNILYGCSTNEKTTCDKK